MIRAYGKSPNELSFAWFYFYDRSIKALGKLDDEATGIIKLKRRGFRDNVIYQRLDPISDFFYDIGYGFIRLFCVTRKSKIEGFLNLEEFNALEDELENITSKLDMRLHYSEQISDAEEEILLSMIGAARD